MNRILFVGGKTMGHVEPILGILSQMTEKEKEEVYYLSIDQSMEKEVLASYIANDHIFSMSSLGLSHSLGKIFLCLIYFLLSFFHIMKLIMKYQFDFCFCTGGSLTLPCVLAFYVKHKKIYLHEQNVELGLSNRYSLPFATGLYLSLPLSKPLNQKCFVSLVGNPAISFQSLFPIQNIDFQEKKPVLLVVSGSLGGEAFNAKFSQMVHSLEERFSIIWITGKKYFEKYESFSTESIFVTPYLPGLYGYMKQANAIISRSGATTLAELTHLKKCAILVPSPNVARNHQRKNALFYQNHRAALYIEETQFTLENVNKELSKLRCLAPDIYYELTKLDHENPALEIVKKWRENNDRPSGSIMS